MLKKSFEYYMLLEELFSIQKILGYRWKFVDSQIRRLKVSSLAQNLPIVTDRLSTDNA